MAYVCVFTADYFFHADFRIWTLAIKAFEAPILKYLPFGLLFITFYVASSVSTNCFNYNSIGGKSWVNTIIVAFFTALPAIILPLMQQNLDRLQEDVDWLVEKFDYRYKDADWKNSKDANQRGMQKLKGGYPADAPYKPSK